MAGETVITVVGNLTADPELRYTQNGLPVANFTIASTPRNFDRATSEWKDGEALFLRASVWREFAEHVAGSLTKGSRVIATGRLKQRSYETREGEKRTTIELEVDEIGPSLRYATAQVTRAAGGGQSRGQVADEPWATPGSQAATGRRRQRRLVGSPRRLRRRHPVLNTVPEPSRRRRTRWLPPERASDNSLTKENNMAGKSSGDRRKPRKGAKNAAPAKPTRVGVIDYKDVATLRNSSRSAARSVPVVSPVSRCRSSV